MEPDPMVPDAPFIPRYVIRAPRSKIAALMGAISARKPTAEGGYQYHVRVRRGDLPEVVLLPGDPERVEKIASKLDRGEILTRHRGLVVARGRYKGVEVGAVCSGMGAPSTAIVVEELARVGVRTFIRVGSTGALHQRIRLGDAIIATGAVRLEGASRQYVMLEYPAVADHEVTRALIRACEALGLRYHVGVVASTDSFYTGQGRPGFNEYKQSWMEHIVPDLQAAGVLSFEMESSLLFVLSGLYGLRSGSILAVFANRATDEFAVKGEDEIIAAALEAARELCSRPG
jgi:uridine phosphorylase